MPRPSTETVSSFSRPVRQLVSMVMVIAIVGAGVWLAWPQLQGVFLANIWLNGFIGFVFILGVIACFWQVLQLSQSVRWLEQVGPEGQFSGHAPQLLATLAALLHSLGGAQAQISSSSARSILDSIGTRIDEARDIARYLVSLLILLGLLGTFYGLATTVPAVVETIRALAPKEGESAMALFDKLMGGLEQQMGGMGTAFSSSLIGLGGSLVVGLLELFASHGQNRFYRELEEWLSSITSFGLASGDAGDGSPQGALVTVLDRVARQMEFMRELSQRSAARQHGSDSQMLALGQAISQLAHQATAQAQSLERMIALLEASNNHNLATAQASGAQTVLLRELGEHFRRMIEEGPDPEQRQRLRSIDMQLHRLLEEMSAGRQESMLDLRADLNALTTAVRQLSRGNSVSGG